MLPTFQLLNNRLKFSQVQVLRIVGGDLKNQTKDRLNCPPFAKAVV